MADAVTQLQINVMQLSQEMQQTLRKIQNESGLLPSEKMENNNYDSQRSKDMAETICSRVLQIELLINDLPREIKDEKTQLKEIEDLIEENEKVSRELESAKLRAISAQKIISDRLESLTNHICGKEKEKEKEKE